MTAFYILGITFYVLFSVIFIEVSASSVFGAGHLYKSSLGSLIGILITINGHSSIETGIMIKKGKRTQSNQLTFEVVLFVLLIR